MDDHDLHEKIASLVEEERGLRSAGQRLDGDGLERMRKLEVRLDQLWDLLRRREAREELGQDPDVEHERPASIVEKYQQ